MTHKHTIVLIGFMGSGKNYVGKCLAKHLQVRLVDTDRLVVARAGESINQIFKQRGEAVFRRLEHLVLKSVLKAKRPLVVTGGGVVTKIENRRLLKQAHVIWVQASQETILKRLRRDRKRPLLKVDSRVRVIQHLYATRKKYYARLADDCLRNSGYGRRAILKWANSHLRFVRKGDA